MKPPQPYPDHLQKPNESLTLFDFTLIWSLFNSHQFQFVCFAFQSPIIASFAHKQNRNWFRGENQMIEEYWAEKTHFSVDIKLTESAPTATRRRNESLAVCRIFPRCFSPRPVHERDIAWIFNAKMIFLFRARSTRAHSEQNFYQRHAKAKATLISQNFWTNSMMNNRDWRFTFSASQTLTNIRRIKWNLIDEGYTYARWIRYRW